MNKKDLQELEYRVGLILKEELRAYKANGRARGGLGSYSVRLPQQWIRPGKIPTLLGTPSYDSVSSPNETLLLKLYNSLSIEEKSVFNDILLAYLDKDNEYADVGYLIFRVLYRTGQMLLALQYAQQRLWGDGQNAYSNVLGILSQTIIHEYAYCDWPTLRALKELLSKDSEHNFSLVDRINSAEIKLLESELSSVNPEINADEEKLREEFTNYNFPNDLSEALDHINKQLATASSGFDYKDCMAAIRGLTERLFERVAKAVDPQSKIDGKDSEKAAKFFKEKELLSEDAAKLLTSLRHFLSNDGAHRLKSKPEDARLSKNITVELALYLLKRLDVVTKNS